MSKNIDYSIEKPKGGKFFGAFKAHSVAAEVMESKTDRSGKQYHKIVVDFEYDNGFVSEDGELSKKRAFFMLPYDYWKDGTNGQPLSPFRQLCEATKKKLEDFKGDVEKTFVGLDATILVGAQRHWKTKELNLWGENKDKISYGIIGFAPYAKAKTAWTPEMEEVEQQAISELGSSGNRVATADDLVDVSTHNQADKW